MSTDITSGIDTGPGALSREGGQILPAAVQPEVHSEEAAPLEGLPSPQAGLKWVAGQHQEHGVDLVDLNL